MAISSNLQLRRDLFWNAASSIMGSVAMVVMPIVVSRSAGVAAAGVFILATAIGQQFQMLGAYSVRAYQVTDVVPRFPFGVYLSGRLITTLAMIIGIVTMVLVSAKPGQDLLLITLVAMLRVFDALEDVFYGEFQRIGRLDIAGRSNFSRIVVSLVAFIGVIYATDSLLIATSVTTAVSLVAMILLVVLPAKQLFAIAPVFDWRAVRTLLLTCTPLFAGAFLSMYLDNAPRFAVDAFMDADSLAHYGFIFMPALAINVLVMFIFRPLQTRMAHRWAGRDYQGVWSLIRAGFLTIAVASLVTLVACYFFGVPVLSWLYEADLGGLRGPLMVLVVGGVLNAVGIVLYYLLATMRKQRLILIAYAVSAASVWGLAQLLVPGYGIMGAAVAYTASMGILAALFAIQIAIAMRAEIRAAASRSQPLNAAEDGDDKRS